MRSENSDGCRLVVKREKNDLSTVLLRSWQGWRVGAPAGLNAPYRSHINVWPYVHFLNLDAIPTMQF